MGAPATKRPTALEPAADDMGSWAMQNRAGGEGPEEKGPVVAAATSGWEASLLAQYPMKDVPSMQAAVSVPSSGTCEGFTAGRKNFSFTKAGPTGGGWALEEDL